MQKFCQSLQELQQQFPDEHLGAVIAFGSNVWHDLSNGQGAKELKPFVPLGKGLAPATQRDLLIHIQSLRQDINFTLAQAAVAALVARLRLKKRHMVSVGLRSVIYRLHRRYREPTRR